MLHRSRGSKGAGSDKADGIAADAVIAAAARALAQGDALGALKLTALREDAPALALRGTALAQLGDLDRARSLLRRAARAYGPHAARARARCVVAEAEIALAVRDLRKSSRLLKAARATLEACGDRINALHARYLEIRWLLLIGRLGEAERLLSGLDPAQAPAALAAAHELVVADIAVRRLRPGAAREAYLRAARAAARAGIPALMAEVEAAALVLSRPTARLIDQGEQREVTLDEVEALLGSGKLVIDACRSAVRAAGTSVALAYRPVLFQIARALGEAWPADVPRERLAARVFRARQMDESYRARLRVEIGRLRRLLAPVAEIEATARGYALKAAHASGVVVLAQPVSEDHAAVLALLADGESWSSSALALALDVSPRTVQRALEALSAAGKVHPLGQGRTRRWMAPPLPGFATALLLPAPIAGR